MKNKIHFSLRVLDCDVLDALLILMSLNEHERWSSSILNSCKQILGVKRAQFYGGPRAALSLATPLPANKVLLQELDP